MTRLRNDVCIGPGRYLPRGKPRFIGVGTDVRQRSFNEWKGCVFVAQRCRYQRNQCDLSVPWRMLRIPSNATLEMYRLEQRRPTDDINVQLQLPDNSRYPGWFEATVTLQEMLDWYRIQPDRYVVCHRIDETSFPILFLQYGHCIGSFGGW